MTLFLTLLLACGAADEAPADGPAKEAPAKEAPAEEAPAEATPASALQKADAMDGTEDKVIHKCAGCSLGMEGDATHTVTHDGYEMHFCSESCKSGWEADPEKGMKNLEAAVN